MYAVIITVIIIISVLLVLVVLAQNPKGGGLSSQFGGSGASQLMGVKKTGDILEQLTWGFAIAIVILTLSTNFFIEDQANFIESPNIESAQQRGGSPALLPSTDDNAQAPGTSSSDDLGLTNESDSTN